MTTQEHWESALGRWKERLWCNEWRMTTSSTEKIEGETLAQVTPKSRYMHAHVEVALESLKGTSLKDADVAACHEVSHIVISPLIDVLVDLINDLPESRRRGWTQWMDHEKEAVTSHLERIFTKGVRSWRL